MQLRKNKTYIFAILITLIIIVFAFIFTQTINRTNKILEDISNGINLESNINEMKKINDEFKNNMETKFYIAKLYEKYYDENYEESLADLSNLTLSISNGKINGITKYYLEKLRYLNYIELNKGKEVKSSFDILLELCQKYKLYDEFINLCIESSTKLLNLNEGVNIASTVLDEATILLGRIKNVDTQVELLRTASNIYMIEDKLDTALKNQLQALEIAINNDLENQIETILVDMSANYILQENYDEAIDIIENLISNHKIDLQTEVDVLSYLSVAYVEVERYEDTEKILKILDEKIDGLELNLKIANEMWIYIGYADLYNKIGEYEKSEIYLEKSSNLYKKYEDVSFAGTDMNIYIEYGDLYYKIGQYEKSLENHIKAYEIAQERDIKSGVSTILEAIVDDYDKLGDYENADKVLKVVNSMYHKELKKINAEKSNNVYKTILLESRNAKIDRLDKNKDIMNLIILIFIAIILIGYINIKIIKKKKEKIQSLNNQLKDQNLKDALTGLYNRRGLITYIENINVKNNLNKKYAIFMIDVDYFKLYNDGYGHIKGDEILFKIGECLNNICKKDFVGRYGGEEFIIIFSYDNENEIDILANKIKKSIIELNIEHKYSKISDKITLSIGICSKFIRKEDISKAIIKADKALYKTKENGRNNYTKVSFKEEEI